MNILVTGARAPIAADIAKSLSLAGHRVWVADNLRYPVGAASPFVQELVRLPSPREDFHAFVAALLVVCTQFEINVVIPTSEEVFWLAAAAPGFPSSIKLRTSSFSLLHQLHHKGSFAALASRLGCGAAENHEIVRSSDFARLKDPSRYVLKPVYSRFASQTLIGPTAKELRRLRPGPANPWLAQTRVEGRELCVYNIAEAGRILLHVAYQPQFRVGLGASVYFLPMVHDGVRAMSERIIRENRFTGQISFDVMETVGGLVALECNPRGTSGVHLAAQQPAALSAALLGCPPDPATPFLASPRMLLLPMLMQHPGIVLHANGRRLLHEAQDALGAAGISFFAQARAFAEMGWRAARLGMNLPRASTADIEWNGEPIGG